MAKSAVLPRELVQLSTRGRAAFIAEFPDPVLVVRLDEIDGELAKGLTDAASRKSERLLPTIGFETKLGRPVLNVRAILGRKDSAEPLHAQLLSNSQFIAPIRKREGAGKPFSERVSVGRATNNDIVLRHQSVSKFHAWFECDENDVYYLSDAHSTNDTRVNAKSVAGGGHVALIPGDAISFGDVSAIFTTPELLHAALAQVADRV